ncbi:MAG: hypothetical protein H6945_07280 [Zoogloeaceae bacterium]|nr:hypothetical protein [Zoogloeaceae bacterium]
MGQVIDFRTARVVPTPPPPAPLCRCPVCGADLWHVTGVGEVCCADCDAPCPHRLLQKDGS